MKFTQFYFLVVACWCCVWFSGSALGEFIEMDPDNGLWFSQNGVTIRGWASTPPVPLSVWDQAYQKLYVRSPYNGGVPYLGLEPSTGSLMFGSYGAANLHVSTRLGGNDSYYHILFNNPTNYVGIDICWPTGDWTEGTVVNAWAEDANGVEQQVFSRVYDEGPMGTYTPMNLFYPGITRIRITADQKSGFQQRYFGLDNLTFTHINSASAFHMEDNETIVAPDGLYLGNGDSLSGQGTIEGSLICTGANISPGSSPGNIVVNGDYGQDSNSYMLLEIGDGLQDHFQIDGMATLEGTLEISLLQDFTPKIGQIFTLITYGDHQGEFDEIIGLDFEGGLFEPTFGSDSFVITVIPEPATLVLFSIVCTGVLRRCKI